MYKAHSKDINRNKSFHPLTFRNLRKVEQLKEKDAEKERANNKRADELNRDKERRRYDELILNASLALGTEVEGRTPGMGLAHSLQTRKVFAAEYKREDEAKRPVEQTFSGTHSSQAIKGAGSLNFLNKFQQDVAFEDAVTVGAPPIPAECDQGRDEAAACRKRCRDDRDNAKNESLPCTGLVTSSMLSRMKKERDLLQKRRLDPQLRVVAFQNKTVTEAARLRDRQSELMQNGKEHLKGLEGSYDVNDTKTRERDEIEDRIRSILKMKKT